MDFNEGEIIYIDKPLHWTSFDVVKRIRLRILRRIKQKKLKVGHAGTLDPLATGVTGDETDRRISISDQRIYSDFASGSDDTVVRFGNRDRWRLSP